MQLIIKVTTACNLRCVYCSEGDKPVATLPIEKFFKLIDDFPELLNKTGSRCADILWHGGEPLLAGIEYLSKAMAYAVEKLKDYELSFSLQTNGTLITDEWLQLFKQYHVGVGVSLDGYKELHDSTRRTKNDEPTFELVQANIQKLKNAGVYGGSLMVLDTADDVDVDKLFQFIQANDSSVKIHPVIPCGRAAGEKNAAAIGKRYVEIMQELYRKSLELDFPVHISPVSEIVDAILTDSQLMECSFNDSCGKNLLCIFTDGTVSFCGRTGQGQGNERYSFGNIADNSLSEMYFSVKAEEIRQRNSYLLEHDCKNCPYWKWCMGGCSFEAVNAYGTLEHSYPSCQQRKKLLEFLSTDGIQLLKDALVRKKLRYRAQIKKRKSLLGKLENARK